MTESAEKKPRGFISGGCNCIKSQETVKELEEKLKALEKRVAHIEYHNYKPKEYR